MQRLHAIQYVQAPGNDDLFGSASSSADSAPPLTYRDIVRLCRAHGISSHFSNIIGFPQDTEREVHEHLEVLRALTWASFYVLCPIPGTEQYNDFMAAGLVTAKNLDRFDTTCLTWRHPCFSPEQLSALLFDCYRRFFSMRHALRNLCDLYSYGGKGMLGEMMGNAAMSLFSRNCARRRTHPMSGGVARVRLDSAKDFIALRKETFGFEWRRCRGACSCRQPRASSMALLSRMCGQVCRSLLHLLWRSRSGRPSAACWTRLLVNRPRSCGANGSRRRFP